TGSKTPDNTAQISHNKTDFNCGSPTSAYNSPSAITLIPTGCFCAPVAEIIAPGGNTVSQEKRCYSCSDFAMIIRNLAGGQSVAGHLTMGIRRGLSFIVLLARQIVLFHWKIFPATNP
ncbi:hypothetical protein, partial [Symmachiella dynata]|uniref:hypothetical protein n=1 Tax=Symmachiella dynata TaxID=2527995 RepID=UPI0030EB322B